MRTTRYQFAALFCFLATVALIFTNGFASRIFAQSEHPDPFEKIEPIGVVLDEIMRNYVREPDLDKVVEGAIGGMMRSLDRHSSYLFPEMYKEMTEDTEGEFEGIGVTIEENVEHGFITVVQPLPGSPAHEAGVRPGDIIAGIDGQETAGMDINDVANLIKGPRGTIVHLTLLRRSDENGEELDTVEVDIKRGRIDVPSVTEYRVLDDGIGYLRLGDFKKNTAEEMVKCLEDMKEQGMRALVLDLRWNPGGLLTSAKEVSELFLPKNTLVTYTKGRETATGSFTENLKLYTERAPMLPDNFPMVILTNKSTASSSEIVTGALQYWKRAIVIGENTFGKGSVQTIIELPQPENSALRLTTALYYTPAEVTIDGAGIKPDVEAPMSPKDQAKLIEQMHESLRANPNELRNSQNHGTVTGNEAVEGTMEDVQLQRAVEILQEDSVFENLLKKYHKDIKETQVAAADPEEVKTQEAAH